MTVEVAVGELDDLRQAAEVLLEHHDVGEFLVRQVVEAVIGIKERSVLGEVCKMLVEQVEDGLSVESYIIRAGLLIVADDDRGARQAEQRHGIEADLGCLVDYEDVERCRELRAETVERTVLRHDPDRHRVLGLIERAAHLGQPSRSVLSAGLAEAGDRLEVAVQRLALAIAEIVGQPAPRQLSNEVADNPATLSSEFFQFALKLRRAAPVEALAHPCVERPPLPGAG